MRTFIAVDVNENVRGVSQQIVEKLMKRGFKANWVSKENIHLTLFFLGEVQSHKVDEIARHLCHRIMGFPSFSYIVEKLGYFSKQSKPRVIWLGIKSNQALQKLYEEMKSELVKHNFSFEERFSPHITVGRIKDFPGAWQPLIEDITFEPITVAVDRFSIYFSRLTPAGPIYKKVYECRFEGGLIKHE
ncbi:MULTISPECIES: RNA 2',3'-cyclic phosphodiesterase [Pseudothermotoga]|uniref:RNA 2',3'-cyclic phosphodiesterase n=1 Tax=Pseudothermotoga lettingae (strain ATCC BAA-301 / DSM 14385 / NBRC 107922 / TMO) TaxID=416591 RepID=A8F8W1_PSELT|nr:MULTISPECIES: RNA 2',3'-cyclic phosphodiesterase [Pseudothermotoga]ABV34595.1 2'-5' RNA ligase [Pseudothermotoga lettingae TMO]KUK21282.1 MAG: 2'-5' RNA ligase [Pseudothermotoga lettingae]MDI3494785.1 2,3-cyclic 3-phosphodiesterase [Pseudothermotoga sp.]MDK2883459.1 2,3-cyclic 3-phosphodiesterase [Pseudothermotoga sp.]GLI48459.1 RNA 2',3'-cyclic phosphodiesterase [Pseudothermotoga lettingae TMO]